MKTQKTILLGLIAILVTGYLASCASSKPDKTSQADKDSIIMTVLIGLTDSIEEAREIQSRLTAEQQQAFLEKHANATNDPGLQKVKEAKGVDAKLAQIWENLRESTRTAQEREQARRAEIDEQASSVNPYIRAREEN